VKNTLSEFRKYFSKFYYTHISNKICVLDLLAKETSLDAKAKANAKD